MLEKVITFVRTPNKVDLGEIYQDVSQFCRRLNLKVYFHDDNLDQTPNSQSIKYQNEYTNSRIKITSVQKLVI